MSFPFPKLLEFLENEKDQVEFMKVAAEVGLGNGDVELGKLLLALQLYKAFYAAIPRQIKAVHAEALREMQIVREEVAFIGNRASSDAITVGQWTEEIQRLLLQRDPKKTAELVHKRLLEDVSNMLGGTLKAFTNSQSQIDAATQKMNVAAYQAAKAIEDWEIISLRRVWACAFGVSLVIAFLILSGIWFVFLRHQAWWLSLQ